jgi:hypothetical protein
MADAADAALPAGERPGLLVRLAPSSGRAPAGAAPSASAAVARTVAELGGSWETAFPTLPRLPAGLRSRARGADPTRAAELRAELSAMAVGRFPDALARDAAMARLQELPEVALVEPITPITLDDEQPVESPLTGPARVPAPVRSGSPSASPNGALPPIDKQFPEQWALPLIGMLAVWAEGAGTPGLVIAIVDTGIETEHPDLAPNLAVNAAEAAGAVGIDDDENGYVDDVHGWNALEQNADIEDGFGHGTHVSGIVGAVADGRGTVGVTWDAELVPVRMFDDLGRGTNLAGAQAITYAADRGAEVINMSWGTARRSGAIELAIQYAAATGAVLVASAGNAGDQVLDNFPAAYDLVISVGATTDDDGRAGFSNHGVRVDLSAPGVNILSTEHGAYFSLSGTSQSAAFVTGVAAHLRFRYPDLPAEEVRAILRQSAVDLGRNGWDPYFGAGRLDAGRALGNPQAPIAEIRTPRTQTATAAETIEIAAAVEPPAGAMGPVAYALDFGPSEDPGAFEPWAAGTGRGLFQFPPLPLAGRPEGDLTLRLVVRDEHGGEAEDRVLIRIDRRPPALVRREVVNRLAGGRLDQWIRYQADEPVVGRVYARPSDTHAVPVMFGSLEAARDHTADLGSLLPGRYEYWIDIQDMAGFESRSAGPGGDPYGREILPVIDVPATGFHLREQFAAVNLGTVADLDGDGRAEVLVERTGDGGGVAVLGVESPGGRLAVRATGKPRGLPLAARDVDRDGVPEVLVADHGLSLYRDLFGVVPETLWKEPLGDRRSGGQLTDVDGDGAVEVLFSTLAGAQLTMVEWHGAGFDPVPLELSRPTLAAGFAVADYDRDSRTEIVFGSLSGEFVALESTPAGIVEILREPFLGGLANAVTACPIGDGDGDGRPELAISAVGALLDRGEHPTVAILESPADDRYAVATQYEFRDKNTPYDNALAAGDVDGDGVPELLVAQAGDIYLLAADRENRYLPIWRARRAPGGRAAIGDLDGDGAGEILFSEQIQGTPVTSIYEMTTSEPATALAWRPVLHPLGNEVRWEAPAAGVRVFDLALYRPRAGAARVAPPVLESDLAAARIFEQLGEVTSGSVFRDADQPPGGIPYFLAYTRDDGKSRVRVLDGPRSAAEAPGVPALLVLDPFPNPAPGTVELGVALARSGPVTIRIVDLAGRVRRRLLADELPAGRHALTWDGRDQDGHRLGRGVYYVAVSGLGEEAAARVALIGEGGK